MISVGGNAQVHEDRRSCVPWDWYHEVLILVVSSGGSVTGPLTVSITLATSR